MPVETRPPLAPWLAALLKGGREDRSIDTPRHRWRRGDVSTSLIARATMGWRGVVAHQIGLGVDKEAAIVLPKAEPEGCGDHHLTTPLLTAVMKSDTAMVDTLLELGADPNGRPSTQTDDPRILDTLPLDACLGIIDKHTRTVRLRAGSRPSCYATEPCTHKAASNCRHASPSGATDGTSCASTRAASRSPLTGNWKRRRWRTHLEEAASSPRARASRRHARRRREGWTDGG
jgi:hypothetical protein